MRDSSRYPATSTLDQDEPLQEHLTAEARDLICRQGEPTAGVDILCEGFAYRFHQFPDGTRQLLSILHPGDVFSSASLFEAKAAQSVAALTDIRFCRFNRSELRKEFDARAEVFEALGLCFSSEVHELDLLAANLGRRRPDERIAYFLLQFANQSAKRRSGATGHSVPFPLHETDLADALGLAPTTVERVLTTLQKNNVIDISDGILTIVNAAELNRLAEL